MTVPPAMWRATRGGLPPYLTNDQADDSLQLSISSAACSSVPHGSNFINLFYEVPEHILQALLAQNRCVLISPRAANLQLKKRCRRCMLVHSCACRGACWIFLKHSFGFLRKGQGFCRGLLWQNAVPHLVVVQKYTLAFASCEE